MPPDCAAQRRRNVADPRGIREERHLCCERQRQEAIDGVAIPSKRLALRMLKELLHDEATQYPFHGMLKDDLLDIADIILLFQQKDGPQPKIIFERWMVGFVADQITANNWQTTHKPPNTSVLNNDQKTIHVVVGTLKEDCPESQTKSAARRKRERQTGEEEDPERSTPQRRKGANVFLQMLRNTLVQLHGNLNLEDECICMLLDHDEANQDYVTRFNSQLLVHAARWRLWRTHGDPATFSAADATEEPLRRLRDHLFKPNFKINQISRFTNRARIAAEARGLRQKD
ncbi:MAG: hypothetical protein M1837_004051 [Sclerophora amabilis]|nr:MAG: hypothetical protein M1837_004051 [Sclerophora amabilis]